MSYEKVIEQVKTLPEQLLTSVSAFIKLLEAEESEMYEIKTASKTKKNFFELAGKIHLDSNSVTELRETSLL
ncbi:MAG: hypothetical protein J6U06_09130 [Spirochaetaceae bacterium]|nr:hypothetical protein [Spirochaetaceae bacterium]